MAGAALAAAAAAAAAARKRAQQQIEIEECRAIYPEIAAANGLRDGLSEQQMPMIHGDHQGVACSVAIILDPNGWAHTLAPPPSRSTSTLFQLAVVPSPRGCARLPEAAVREHDVRVGDDAFDDAFLVDAVPRERAADLLSAPIREALTGMVGHGLTSFTVEPDGVFLQWNAVEQSADVILAAIDVVTTAARFRVVDGQPYR